MPKFDWQLILALFAVAAAGWFLVRRCLKAWRAAAKSDRTCGSCGSCATAENRSATASPTFVPLDALVPQDDK